MRGGPHELKTQQRSRVTLPLAIALVRLPWCGDDDTGLGGAAGRRRAEHDGGQHGGHRGRSRARGGGGAAGTGGSRAAAARRAAVVAGSGVPVAARARWRERRGGGSEQRWNAGRRRRDDPMMNFFVSSETSKTGNLGGLRGADARCQRLATAVGFGSKTWRAYLSAEAADGGQAVNAKDRIGPGPYYNAKGVMLAANSAALHARNGDAEVFITEEGEKVNGQWAGSPTPNEHDVLTGSMGDGTVLAGQTCLNWTSEAMANTAQIGHTDGLGPMMNPAPPTTRGTRRTSTAVATTRRPRGGAGRIYCFVGP